MAKQEVGLKIDVDVSSVGNVKKELRAAQTELIAMRDRFGETSQEAINAARKVADLRDRIEGAKEAADLFDPGKRFQAFTTAASQLAAGFSAVQGAMALAGNESEDLQKTLARVQGAMALSQGLSELKDLGKSYEQLKIVAIGLGNTIKTQVVAAFTTLRGAMMATGIGLITSAVAFLVANFDSVKKTLGDLFPVLKNTGDLMDRLKQIAMGVGNAILQFLAAPVSALIKIFQGDFRGAIDAVKNGFSFVKNFREGEKKEIESQAAEADEARKKELEKQKAANDKKLAEQRRINEELRKERQRAQDELNKFLDQENEKRAKATMTEYEKELFDLRKKFEQQYQLAKKYKLDTKQLDELRLAESATLIAKGVAEETKGNNLVLDNFAKMVPKMATMQSTITANKQVNVDNRKKLDEAEIASREALLMASANALGQLSNLFGQSTAMGKAAALSEIVINTGVGFANGLRIAQQSAAATGPGAAFAFPIFYATQVAAILGAIGRARSILSQVGGGGGASIGGGGVSTAPPVAPKLPPAVEATQVNTAAVNQMGNRAARAYVLNSDIQNENQRNAYIERNASIG